MDVNLSGTAAVGCGDTDTAVAAVVDYILETVHAERDAAEAKAGAETKGPKTVREKRGKHVFEDKTKVASNRNEVKIDFREQEDILSCISIFIIHPRHLPHVAGRAVDRGWPRAECVQRGCRLEALRWHSLLLDMRHGAFLVGNVTGALSLMRHWMWTGGNGILMVAVGAQVSGELLP